VEFYISINFRDAGSFIFLHFYLKISTTEYNGEAFMIEP